MMMVAGTGRSGGRQTGSERRIPLPAEALEFEGGREIPLPRAEWYPTPVKQNPVKRWLAGQRSAAWRSAAEAVRQGARPDLAIAEALSALNAAGDLGLFPAPRDPASEAAIRRVRARWAKVQRRARQAAQR